MEDRAEAAPVRDGELDVGDAQNRQRLQWSRIRLSADTFQEMLPERAISVLRDRAVKVGNGREVAFRRGMAHPRPARRLAQRKRRRPALLDYLECRSKQRLPEISVMVGLVGAARRLAACDRHCFIFAHRVDIVNTHVYGVNMGSLGEVHRVPASMKIAKPYHLDRSTGPWDAIVIGSGIGGVGAAALLSRYGGKRVLVLERHYTPGGFTHVFRRPGYEWDAGVHYIGQVNDPRSRLRAAFDH